MSNLVRAFKLILLVCPVVLFMSCNNLIQNYSLPNTVNPLQFGLNKAKSGEERFYVLQRTHNEAARTGANVSYKGIKVIELDIPSNAKSIPLTHYTDFAGVTLRVNNTQRDFALFTLSNKLNAVEVDGKDIDNKNFSKNTVLRNGKKILVITDKTPWVDNRIGYSYGATRKDIMLLENGIGVNDVVQSYTTAASSPNCEYKEVGSQKTLFKNIQFYRTKESTKKTFLVKIENQCDVTLSNISITTPDKSGLNGDRVIEITNCIDVSIEDVSIRGTYSLKNKYGYGILLNNIYDLRVNNLYARANWGVFGNNNVNKAFLKECDINRFDIHCYGKDISFEDCNFVNLYNQFSSVYGLVSFKNCTFSNFTPVLLGSSYNAYTAFNILFDHCTFNLDNKHFCIIDFSGFCEKENSRPELKEKCLPNVSILDCQVNLSDDLKKWVVYNTKKTSIYQGLISYLSNVSIKGIHGNGAQTKMDVFSKELRTLKKVVVVKE